MDTPTSDSDTSFRARSLNSIHWIINNLSRGFLVIMVVTISYTVFGRFVLNSTPAWGEPLGLLCLVWFSLLTVPIAFIHKSHIRITVLEMMLKGRHMRGINLIIYVVLLGFSVFMVIYGMQVTELTWPTIIPGLQISRGLLYLSVPASGIFSIIVLLLMMKEYLW